MLSLIEKTQNALASLHVKITFARKQTKRARQDGDSEAAGWWKMREVSLSVVHHRVTTRTETACPVCFPEDASLEKLLSA